MFRIENCTQSYFKKISPIQRNKNKNIIITRQEHNIGDMKLSTDIFQTLNDGWLICNGSSLSIDSFPDLFSVIGYSFGSIDNQHFNLPDYTSRVIGVSGKSESKSFSLSERKIGDSIGTEVETLLIENLPKHSHNGSTDLAGLHTHYSKIIETNNTGTQKVYQYEGEKQQNNLVTSFSSESGVHQHRFVSSEVGSGKSYNNIQPTLFGCNIFIYSKK